MRNTYPRGGFLRSLAVALCVALTLTASPVNSFTLPPHAAQATARAAQLPPRQTAPTHDYDVRHIKLDLRFDWEREQARGTATLIFAPTVTNFRRLDLDAANMTIQGVKFISGATLPHTFDAEAEKLRITLDRAYRPADELTIQITYNTNGTLAGTGILGFGQGLTFIKPNAADPQRPRQIWSQGESEYNHTWFPCWDHPNDFATSEMIATVDRPYTVISNGRLLDTRDNADRTRTFHWRMDQPHASYLVSIVVGEYAAINQDFDGTPVTSYVYPNEVEQGRETFARTPEMMRFFSELTGVRYPYAKYAQTTVRDFGGGMENITATTLTDSVIHDRRTTLDGNQDGLIAHELAHQWFGDYVTSRTWEHIWLNESFATYMQALWTEASRGRDDFLYSDVLANKDAYFEAWKSGLRRPVVTPHYRNADDLFDVYAYPRGAAVLHMLRVMLGEEKWRAGVRRYISKHAHQPVETEQLRRAFEEATKQDLSWFFRQWLYQMNHPVLRVTKNYDEGSRTLRVNVRQEQKPDPTSAYPQTELFRLPVDVGIKTATASRVERIRVEPQTEQTFEFKLDGAPLIVNFDRGGTLIAEVAFDKSIDELAYQLRHDDDVTNRLRALNQFTERAANKNTDAADDERIARALSLTLREDRFWGLRRDAARSLQRSVEKRDAGFPFVREALNSATKDADARVRLAAVTALGASKDTSHARLYADLLDDESYTVVRRAARLLAETKDATAYERLARLAETSSWRDQLRAGALSALGALGDVRALPLARRYAAAGGDPGTRVNSIDLLGALGAGDAEAVRLIRVALVEGAAGNSNPLMTAAAEALLRIGDKSGVEALREARARTTNDTLRTALILYEQRLTTANSRP